MWMVGGYNDSSHHNNHHHEALNLDALSGRKLRPLIPRPPPVVASSPTNHSCNFGLYTGSHLFSLTQHLRVGGEQGIKQKNINRDEVSINKVAAVNNTTRWNPTAEQLRTLEELYRRGTRTPTTEQIQRITAELRRHGKIEGKNVFYWFQNHKARERQKRRRDLQLLSHHPHPHQTKERGPASRKLGVEAEQTRCPYNIIASPPAQEGGVTTSMQIRKAGGSMSTNISSSNSASACLFQQVDDERNATWQNLTQSSSPPTKTSRSIENNIEYEEEEDGEDCATLELFPLRSQQLQEEAHQDNSQEKDLHFFQFLPPKT